MERDGVVAIFGPTEIGQKMAVAQYMKSVGLPNIIYNPSPPILAQDNKWVVGAGGTTPQMPSCMGDYLYQKAGYRTINTITYDDSAGKAFMDPLTQVFTQEGGEVVKQAMGPRRRLGLLHLPHDAAEGGCDHWLGGRRVCHRSLDAVVWAGHLQDHAHGRRDARWLHRLVHPCRHA